MPKPKTKNRYTQLLERVFFKHYQDGDITVTCLRDEFAEIAQELGIRLPKNLGDLLYSFRYRTELPDTIVEKALPGLEWIIRPAGKSVYQFALVPLAVIVPTAGLVQTKIPDATPEVIALYAQSDEQALLAKLRYNRLIDLFTGLVCYSLQNHFRTTVPEMGQVETDELYVGLDRRGVHYVLTVQAKGGHDKLGIVQIEQDFAVCEAKFPALVSRPLAAQFMADGVIALFEFARTNDGVRVAAEKHYRLVQGQDVSAEELQADQKRPD